MIAAGVPFEEIEVSHLRALIDGGYAERQTVEYKRELPKPTSAGKKEFLADVSSFANASGGDLVYGIEAKSGVPVAFAPLAGDADAEKLAWQSSLQGGVSPRIPGVQLREIAVEDGYVLLLRVPKSWAGPHAVTLEGSFRFYARNSAGKYALDVGELRVAFHGGNELAEHVRRFRAERLASISAGETPMPLDSASGKIVVHLIPYDAFGTPSSLELNATEGSGLFHPPFEAGASSTRWNLDGLFSYSRTREDEFVHAYAQLFRNGIYEGVEGSMLRTVEHPLFNAPYLYGGWIESALNRGLANPLQVLSRIGVQPPIVVLVSLLAMKGRVLLASDASLPRASTFDRDLLLLPELVLDAYPTSARAELPRLLRPIIDAFWQAGGWQRSPFYDANGDWEGNRP